jgi:gas vesicle protein
MDEQNSRVGGKRPRAGAGSGVTGLAESKRVTRFDEGTADRNEGRARPKPRPVDPAEEENPEVRTHEIRAEIEQTREDMSETVNAIQERLRPGAIAARTAENVKQAAVETAREVADSDSVQYVRANPIPTVMVGVGIAGLAWLATRGNDGRSSRRSDFRGESSRTRRDLNSDAYRVSGDSYGDAYSQGMGRESLGRPGFALADTGVYLPAQLRRTWNETPLLIGAASAILGAIVGLTVPETNRENQLMGETRDSMLDTVQETVRDKVNQVQQAATDAAGMVQEAAKSAVGLPSHDSTNTEA